MDISAGFSNLSCRGSTSQPAIKKQLSFVWKKPQSATQIRKTKIVCTIGPASWSLVMLKQLLVEGMDVARLNFSHGDHETHARTISRIREASKSVGKLCAIMLDNKGPEIRTGKLKGGKPVLLQKNQILYIFCTDKEFFGDTEKIALDYLDMPKILTKGSVIKIDDGLIITTVLSIDGQMIRVRVETTAELGQNKGVNLPGATVNLPALTQRDKADLRFGVAHGVDFVAISFVRRESDVKAVREVLGEDGKNIMVISKIENQEGLDNFEDILSVSDSIMVARGDLGVEIPIHKVCTAQKMIITKCNLAGKPVITATQMLDSMIDNPRPTRAEAGDVANAVFDGTDCVMLSGETAKGKYPCSAVNTMHKICLTTETAIDYEATFYQISRGTKKVNKAEAIVSSAVKSLGDLGGKIIIVLTESGSTGRFVSKYKPNAPVVALTSNSSTARQLLLSRALIPFISRLQDEHELCNQGISFSKKMGWIKRGEPVILVMGLGTKPGSTNTMRIVDCD